MNSYKNINFFYIAGPDGSGKTAHVHALIKYLASKGIIIRHIWLRSPKFFSKPLMAYCRLIGLTRYRTINGIRIGKHEFYRSKFVSLIFPWLQFIDMKIFNFFKVKLPVIVKKKSIIFDRYTLDTLADLMVDTGRYNLHKTLLGTMFIKLLPPTSKIVILEVNEETLKKRKKDVFLDPQIEDRVKAFRKIAEDLKINLVDNNRAFSIVSEEICNFFVNSHERI